MPSHRARIDRFFLISVGVLSFAGFVIFLSASLGLIAQNNTSFASIAFKQCLSLGLGMAAFLLFSKLPYRRLKSWSFFIFVGAIIVNLLLFIPAFSHYHGGATRWLSLGSLSFQPSELLKISFIIYLAAWIQFSKDKIRTFKHGLLPYLVIVGILTLLLLAQRDTDTLVIIAFSGVVMLFVARVPLKQILLAGLLMAVVVAGVIATRPYALARVKVFFDRSSDTRGASYQINQSLIAIGSGQATGRGFGQSIQKFGYLPQPTDDSIFAVAAEEFGFVGGVVLLLMYLSFAASAFRIAARAPDLFGGLVAVGIAVLIVTESFMNMAAMMGLLPLSGVPLLFVSHGGTALIIALAAAGIVANISKHQHA